MLVVALLCMQLCFHVLLTCVAEYECHCVLVSAGANTWPGANILQLQDGSKYMLRAGAARRAADELRIGDIVQAYII